MTHEQLIAKARQEAEYWSVPTSYFQHAKLREMVKVSFTSPELQGSVEIDLDRGDATEHAMTHDKFIARAREEVERSDLPTRNLQHAELREIVRISFCSPELGGTVQIDLDQGTGQFVTASASAGIELKPRNKGKEFSKAAQDLLARANDESKRMGCDHVGSDHLLLAAVSRDTEIGSMLLKNAGLTAEAVRTRLLSTGSVPEDAPTGYGPSMRGVLRSACRYADSLGHAEVTPEHLILGLLDETDGGARNLFSHFGINTEETKNKILEALRKESR